MTSHLYNVWKRLRSKCNNPNCLEYTKSGALGIKYDPKWDDFQVFKDWAEKNNYKNSNILKREDNLKDYCESNCFWQTRHNQTNTRLYSIWNNMRQRCGNSNKPDYHNYGERGIRVCEAWQVFTPFWDWSKLHGYSDELTLDRIDNNLGYFPDNCRWTTRAQQAWNKRKKKNCSSKYIGVYFHKQRQKWIASIRPNKKLIHLGYFDIEEKASEAYQKARLIHFKES